MVKIPFKNIEVSRRLTIQIAVSFLIIAVAAVSLMLGIDTGVAPESMVLTYEGKDLDETTKKEHEIASKLFEEGRILPDDPQGRTIYYIAGNIEEETTPEKMPDKMNVYEVESPYHTRELALEAAMKFGIDDIKAFTWAECKKEPEEFFWIHADEVIDKGQRYPEDIIAYSWGENIDEQHEILMDGLAGRLDWGYGCMKEVDMIEEAGSVPAGINAEALAIQKLEEFDMLPPHYYVSGTGGEQRGKLEGREVVYYQRTASATIRGKVDGFSTIGGLGMSCTCEFDAMGRLLSLDNNWPSLELEGSYPIKTSEDAIEDLKKGDVYERDKYAAHVAIYRIELCYRAETPAAEQTRLEPAYFITGTVMRDYLPGSRDSKKVSDSFEAMVPALK